MKDIVIFSRGIANKLIYEKFVLKRIGQDKQDAKASVFYFENTKEIKEYLAATYNIFIK